MYTGRNIKVTSSDDILVAQQEFIHGRMDRLTVKKMPGRAEEHPCTPIETADFRSATGNMHWVTSQTRFDKAVETSKFQKRQNHPTWSDYKALAKSVRQLKNTSHVGITIKKIVNPCVMVWTDSSLYGSSGELLDDSDLDGYDKH